MIERDDWYVVTLSETDADANKATLQAALNSNKYVMIKAGSYPLSPTVTINSAVLDLGGSTLTDPTESGTSGTLFYLIGDSPTIQNGSIVGMGYITYTGTSDPLFFEGRRFISPVKASYTNARIEAMDLSHCYGYAISGGGSTKATTDYVANVGMTGNAYFEIYQTFLTVPIRIPGADTTCVSDANRLGGKTVTTGTGLEFTSDLIPLSAVYTAQEKYDSLMLFHGKPGYVCISTGRATKHCCDGDMTFVFTLSDGSTVSADTLQSKPVKIPDNASTFVIKMPMSTKFVNGDSYRDPANMLVYFFYHDCSLNVSGCTFHENTSLGMTGATIGPTYVDSCVSEYNGRAGGHDTATGNTTTGFIDCEEDPPCYISITNCASSNETNSAMLNVVTADVKNCEFVTCLNYGGKWMNINNVHCEGFIGLNSSVSNRATVVSIKDSSGQYGVDGLTWGSNIDNTRCASNVITENCSFYNSWPPRPRTLDTNSAYYYTSYGISRVNLTGDYAGTFYLWTPNGCRYTVSNGGFAPPEGSAVKIKANNWITISSKTIDDKNNWLRLSGDGHVLESDISILPNGYVLSGCTFDIGTAFLYGNDQVDSYFAGTYRDCTFNLDNNPFYSPRLDFPMYGACATGQQIKFERCTINNSANYLYDGSVSGTFVFTDCEIADENKICKGGTSTYKFLYSLTPAFTGCSASVPETIERGGSTSIQLTADSGYSLPETVSVTGANSSYDASTGVISLTSAASPITITAVAPEVAPTVYSVTKTGVNCNISGADAITEGTTETFSVIVEDGYKYPDSVTISGADYVWDSSTGAIAISNPISDVSISVTAVEDTPTVIKYSITIVQSGCDVLSPKTIEEGTVEEITVVLLDGYKMPESISVTNASYTMSGLTIKIFNPTGDVKIIINCISTLDRMDRFSGGSKGDWNAELGDLASKVYVPDMKSTLFKAFESIGRALEDVIKD